MEMFFSLLQDLFWVSIYGILVLGSLILILLAIFFPRVAGRMLLKAFWRAYRVVKNMLIALDDLV